MISEAPNKKTSRKKYSGGDRFRTGLCHSPNNSLNNESETYPSSAKGQEKSNAANQDESYASSRPDPTGKSSFFLLMLAEPEVLISSSTNILIFQSRLLSLA